VLSLLYDGEIKMCVLMTTTMMTTTMTECAMYNKGNKLNVHTSKIVALH